MAYAHGGTGPKIVLKEIERLSYLTTGTTNMVVAYDYWCAIRSGGRCATIPTRSISTTTRRQDIRRAAIVVVGEQNNDKVVPILGQDYVGFRLVRMWWHNEDYFNLKWDFINSEYLGNESVKKHQIPAAHVHLATICKLAWGHISPFFTNPKVREAVFQIWLNRDFT